MMTRLLPRNDAYDRHPRLTARVRKLKARLDRELDRLDRELDQAGERENTIYSPKSGDKSSMKFSLRSYGYKSGSRRISR